MDFNHLSDGTKEIIINGTEAEFFELKLCGLNGLCLVADSKYLKVYRQIQINKEYRLISKILLKEKLPDNVGNILIDDDLVL